MATINWKTGVSGTWETASDWSTGAVPAAGDDVSINVGGTYTVTIAAAASAHSLTIGDASATLDLGANLTLSEGLFDTQSLIDIAAGTLAVTGGAVTFGAAGSASAGATVNGPGTLSTAKGVITTVNAGYSGYGYPVQLVLGGGVTWSNSGTVADLGRIQIGNGSGETAKIINNAGGVFQFEGPDGQIYDNAGATGSFVNAGTIDVDSTANFALALTNTGLIDLQSGVLNLQANASLAGTIAGAGILEISGGATTLTAATSGNLLVAGGALTLADATTITGAVSETSGVIYLGTTTPATETLSNSFSDTAGELSIGSGKTLSLSGGSVTFGVAGSGSAGATVNGPGTLSTAKGVTTTVNAGYSGYGYPVQLVLGGGVTWSNSGTVADLGSIQIGNGSGETAKIINNAGGVFQFEGPDGQIYDNAGATGSFVNAGTLIEAASSGSTTDLATFLTNSGVIDANSGFLDLQGGGAIGGTIEAGGGTVQLGGGVFALTGAVDGNVLASGGVVTIDTAKTITGSITNNGATMLIGGNTALSGVIVDQSGLLQISGDKLTAKAATIDGGATLSGYGTVGAQSIDNGVVLAESGVLVLGASAYGTGTAEIGGGATLSFLGGSAISTISFLSGGAETLALQTPGAVTGTITGFGATDTIDLVKTVATGLAFANGTLTVTGATGTLAMLDFGGTYSTANFALQSDGNSGTDIVYQQASGVPTHALTTDFSQASTWLNGLSDKVAASRAHFNGVAHAPLFDDAVGLSPAPAFSHYTLMA
jgi:hypothetical protein